MEAVGLPTNRQFQIFLVTTVLDRFTLRLAISAWMFGYYKTLHQRLPAHAFSTLVRLWQTLTAEIGHSNNHVMGDRRSRTVLFEGRAPCRSSARAAVWWPTRSDESGPGTRTQISDKSTTNGRHFVAVCWMRLLVCVPPIGDTRHWLLAVAPSRRFVFLYRLG